MISRDDLLNEDAFVFTEQQIKELPQYPDIHKKIAQKYGYKFISDIDSFRVYFDTNVDYPTEQTRKNGIQENFFLAKRKDKSILYSTKNIQKLLKDTYKIDCDYIESEEEIHDYNKPTIVKKEDKYLLLGLKDIEAHKYANETIEDELLEKHHCAYYSTVDTKTYLCVLVPTSKINDSTLDFDEIIFVGNDIAKFRFGGEADFDVSKMESILEYMIRRNIGNLHFNASRDTYAIIVEEDKVKKTLAQVPKVLVEDGLIHRLKKETNEDEYNDFKEVKKTIRHNGRDFRFSIKKAKSGYRCAFRLLSSEKMISDLENLNYTPTALKLFHTITDEHYGLQKGMRGIIIAGSTGEGKSTLAYGMIKRLLKQRKLIAEIGNPVEIILSDDTITQFDLSDSENAEKDQQDTLLHLLSVQKRQNPDILYITEVRDAEEKKEVFNHIAQGFGMIFTMHTHDTWKTLEDLMTVMGEEAYKVGDSIGTIINHKLIKAICKTCKGTGNRGSKNCLDCNGSGEKGVVPIIEKWERKKQTKILPKINKDNYDAPDVCDNFHSFKDDIMEQLSLGRISKRVADIEINKLYGEELVCVL